MQGVHKVYYNFFKSTGTPCPLGRVLRSEERTIARIYVNLYIAGKLWTRAIQRYIGLHSSEHLFSHNFSKTGLKGWLSPEYIHTYIHTVYIECTYSVHRVYIQCTYIHTVYIECTYSVHTVYIHTYMHVPGSPSGTYPDGAAN
jgi:hypothetical protein